MQKRHGSVGGSRIGAAATLLAVGSSLAGCSSTRMATGADQYSACEEIRNATTGRTARIVLVDGTDTEGTMIYVQADSLHWRFPRDMTAMSTHLGDVRSIAITRHGKGAGQGLGLGALMGGLLGAVAGYADGDDPSGFVSFSAGAKAGMVGVAGVLGGGLLGAIIGGAAGSTLSYEFYDTTALGPVGGEP